MVLYLPMTIIDLIRERKERGKTRDGICPYYEFINC